MVAVGGTGVSDGGRAVFVGGSTVSDGIEVKVGVWVYSVGLSVLVGRNGWVVAVGD